MKKLIVLVYFLAISCNSIVEKPDNLIDEDTMVDIIYDISLLDAMKSQNLTNQSNFPNNSVLLKKKYNVDSLTFAKSSQYYASDQRKYKKMYEEVKARLEEDAKKANGGQPVAPNDNQGYVK